MRVMTMSGGFRGLGALSLDRREAARAGFLDRVAALDELFDRLQTATGAGEFQGDLSSALSDRYFALNDVVGEHLLQLDQVETEQDLRDWQNGSSQVVRQVNAWVSDARRLLGEQQANRGLRIFLLAAASITVIGGASYVVYKANR